MTTDLAVVAATWRSRRALGDLGAPGGAGDAGDVRTGRVTLVLRAEPDGALRAVHSHFSMAPGTRA